MKPPIEIIEAQGLPTIYHLGPPLSEGPLPSVFYFSLSGEESLTLDPYNQPTVHLSKKNIRVFSITLPGHEGNFPHSLAIKSWADHLGAGINLIEQFVAICQKTLSYLIDCSYVDQAFIGVAGLSRGAYLATHVAAKDERIHTILGFAPLTTLETMKDFQELKEDPLIQSLSLKNIIPELTNKKIRFYIGNYDTLVDTAQCFSFIHSLAEKSYLEKRRFAPIELIIYPAIGHKGHGTPPEIFHEGALWLANSLN